MTQNPSPRFRGANSVSGIRRRNLILPVTLVLLTGFYLHRTLGTLPPICPPSDSKPGRIVSLSLGIDETLIDLVPPKRIRALTYLSVNPEFSNVAERARAYPRHNVRSVEEVASLRPDLILASSFNDREKLESLRALGCRVVIVSKFGSIAEIRRTVIEIAAAVGEVRRGLELVERMDRTLREAARLHPAGGKKPRVVFAGPGGYTQGTGTTINDLIVRAGGINAAAASLTGIGRLTAEEWLSLQPDVLLRMSYSQLDPFLAGIYRMGEKGGRTVPTEVVMPSRLLTSTAPSSAKAVGLLAEKLREAMANQ
jgi:ABC-type Fe3+-hydroxamate transport system substrate-binding protein